MKSWELNRISGSTPEVRDYCRELYLFYTKTTAPEYFSIGTRGGKTPGTYKRFHAAIEEISKHYPEDTLTLQYTFKNHEDEPGETQIIGYKNGMAVIVS